jgi:hypothetical protein
MSNHEQVSDCVAPNRPYMVAINADLKRAILFRPRCGSWSCPYCAQVNQSRWAVRAYYGTLVYQSAGDEVDFLTLTSHEKLNPAQTRWVFPKAWKKLSQRARRAADGFDYLMIPEVHKDGRLHIHAVETSALGESWWKDNARASGLGYMDEEEPIRKPAGAAAYVVKYIGKTLTISTWPRSFHRVRTSRRWPSLPPLVQPDGWRFETVPPFMPLWSVALRYKGEGYDLHITGSAAAWGLIDGEAVDL